MAACMMAFALATLLAMPAMAGSLPDPTALPSMQTANGGEDQQAWTLTAIKLSHKQKIAVIDGQEVTVGGRYQDARVVRIGESEVVLRRGRDTTVLKLYPNIEKTLRSK